MQPPIITGFYAGLLGLILLALSIRIIVVRREKRVSIGDAGDDNLARRIRAHGNFIEYVPVALFLIAFVELTDYPSWVVHALGIALVVGRIVHAWSMAMIIDRTNTAPGKMPPAIVVRFVGMVLTFIVLAAGSILNIATFLRHA